MDELEFLQGVDLCQGLTPRELGLVRNYCREGSCREHDILHKEGDPARDMCFPISGQVDLRYRLPGKEISKETTVSSLLPGADLWMVCPGSSPPAYSNRSVRQASPQFSHDSRPGFDGAL